MPQSQWLREKQSDGHRLEYRIRQILHHERSDFQEIVVAELDDFGRTLILDDIVQTTEADEFIYHEMLAHVPLFAHPEPRDVLVVGGGDGGTVREVLKHPSVESVHLAEIDGAVVRACREHLRIDDGALSDERLQIHITDGFKHIQEHPESYDVILVDAPDPLGPAEILFSSEFYTGIRQALRPGGVFSTQSGAPFWSGSHLKEVFDSASDEFPQTAVYLTAVPTYPGGYWSYVCGSLQGDPQETHRQPDPNWELRCYSPELHQAAFHLPHFIKEMLVD